MSAGALRALGLCKRAGALITGTPMICDALRDGKRKPLMVLMASDVSEGTKKKLRTKCEFYGVKMITTDIELGELGRLLGKTYAPACVGVTDEGFAKELARLAEST